MRAADLRISDRSADVCSPHLPDREADAIAWHIREVVNGRRALPKEVERVTFNAVPKPAVTAAMKAPRDLDEDLIDAYRARRALDYLVGFNLSPVLWRKLPGAKIGRAHV